MIYRQYHFRLHFLNSFKDDPDHLIRSNIRGGSNGFSAINGYLVLVLSLVFLTISTPSISSDLDFYIIS